jgi:hypothetical protein
MNEYIHALEQTLEYLKSEQYKSHQGYFYNGWAGQKLRKLLTLIETIETLKALVKDTES